MADVSMTEVQEDPLSLPPHGTEVFFGGLPRTITEQQLRDFASEAGDVHSAKLIRDPNNPTQNRGYGFVKFYTREAASAAMDRLPHRELPDFPGTRVRIQPSQAKHKLFIGGIPHELTREGLRALLDPIVKGLEKIDMVKSKDPAHPEQNRGFAFLEFYNSACAAAAKTVLSQPDFKVGDRTPTVDYAEPGKDAQGGGGGGGAAAGVAVKNVFVGNLPPGASEERLRDIFNKYGEVERTHIPRPRDGDSHSKFGFVHFRERAAAVRAVEDADKPTLDGAQLNVRYGRSDSTGGQQQGGGGGMGRSAGAAAGGGAGYGAGGGVVGGLGGAGAFDMSAAAGGLGGLGMGGLGGMGGMGMMMGGNLVSLVPVQLPNGQIGYMMAGGAGMPAAGGVADAGGSGGPMRGSGAGGYGGRGGGAYGGGAGRGGRGRGGGGPGGQRYQPY